jgi:hypothetical protein
MGNIVNVFKAGHRIKLEIDSMLAPRDPEIQIHYHPLLNSSRITLHKVSAGYQSHLVPSPPEKKRWRRFGDEFQEGVD